jgi:hypothetical protein
MLKKMNNFSTTTVSHHYFLKQNFRTICCNDDSIYLLLSHPDCSSFDRMARRERNCKIGFCGLQQKSETEVVGVDD